MQRMHLFCTLRVILKPGTYGSQGTSLVMLLPTNPRWNASSDRHRTAGPASSGILRAIKGSALADSRSCRKAQQALACLPGFVFW